MPTRLLSSIPTNDLNGAFWLSMAGVVSALCGVVLRSMYKSKCSEVDLCCIKIKRDISAEVKEDLGIKDAETSGGLSDQQRNRSMDGKTGRFIAETDAMRPRRHSITLPATPMSRA